MEFKLNHEERDMLIFLAESRVFELEPLMRTAHNDTHFASLQNDVDILNSALDGLNTEILDDDAAAKHTANMHQQNRVRPQDWYQYFPW